MKAPPSFSTGDPSYFVVASTSGSASPTVRTAANTHAAVCRPGLRVINAQYSHWRDATQFRPVRASGDRRDAEYNSPLW